jgi:glycosyltransferase involved in cell wall biosynthesis
MADLAIKQPRLLYIDDIPTPYRIGVQKQVARQWDGQFKVLFCAPSEPGRTWDLDLSGIDHTVLRGWQWRPKGQINPFSFKYNPDVIKQLVLYDPDVVVLAGYAHPTMIRAAAWCRQRNIPYGVTCETSARSTAISGPRWHLRRGMIGWIIRNMAFGLPVGREAASYLRMLGSADAPMCFFPNTPDTAPFVAASRALRDDPAKAVELRARYGLASEGPVFLFVGRLIDAKRPMDALDALDAFKKLNRSLTASLLFVGDGPMMEDLEAAASKHPHIAFGGWVSDQSEIAFLLALATALVLPSKHEPWGAVVNEAMAAGTPVIASDRVGAASEIVEDGVDGFVVRVGDVDGIAAAMNTLLTPGTGSKSYGEMAQKKALANGEGFAAGNLVRGAIAANGAKKSRGS